MKKKEKDFYEAVNAYNIPVLTLDHNWHKLFGNEEATPAVKVLQEELNELLKKQGRAATEGKKDSRLKEEADGRDHSAGRCLQQKGRQGNREKNRRAQETHCRVQREA